MYSGLDKFLLSDKISPLKRSCIHGFDVVEQNVNAEVEKVDEDSIGEKLESVGVDDLLLVVVSELVVGELLLLEGRGLFLGLELG